MSAYVQLVDPGGRFEHAEGTLTHDAVLRLPLDKRVKAGLAGRILRKVEGPAEEPAASAPVVNMATDSATEPKPVNEVTPEPPATAPKSTATKTKATPAAPKP
jgi:hypothetical protein